MLVVAWFQDDWNYLPRRVLVQDLVVRGGVKAANVNIAVAIDAILQALLDGLGVRWWSEHCRDSRVLLEQSDEVLVDCCRSLVKRGWDSRLTPAASSLVRRGGQKTTLRSVRKCSGFREKGICVAAGVERRNGRYRMRRDERRDVRKGHGGYTYSK